MPKLFVYALVAAAGIVTGVAVTMSQNRYLPGDPMNGARMFWVWLAVVAWVITCAAVAVQDVRKPMSREGLVT